MTRAGKERRQGRRGARSSALQEMNEVTGSWIESSAEEGWKVVYHVCLNVGDDTAFHAVTHTEERESNQPKGQGH